MKNAAIFHGAGEGPDSYWLPYLRKELTQRDFQVWVPQLPHPDNPQFTEQKNFVLQNYAFDTETVLIGHSAGSPLILSVLEDIAVTIKLAILVAGYCTPLPQGDNDILQPTYNWQKIKAHTSNLIFINSDNDPWHCDDKQGRDMFDHLGGTLIIRHGEGHMGSAKFKQTYPEFPLLSQLIP